MSSFDNSEDDRKPFLENGEKGGEGYPNVALKKRKSSWFLPFIALLSIAVHILLLLLWMKLSQSPKDILGAPKSSGLYSPFHGAINTQAEIWADDAWDNSVYAGPPRKELDDAWDKLQLVEGISVTAEEAASLNLKSKIILENGNQGAITGYFHNLHCIRYLYKGIHPDIYPPEGGAEHSGLHHSYHCLEVLRRSVICQPDLTIHAIHWQDEERLGMTLEANSTRECVNFDALNDFAMTRRFHRHEIMGEKADLHKST